MSPQHTRTDKSLPDYTELTREAPFSFTAEGSCSKERIEIWAGQFPATQNTGEAEQPPSALGEGLGCHGQRCRTKSWALCVCKALRGHSQGFSHSPDGFIRRTLGEKEEMPQLQQPALGQTRSEGGALPYWSLLKSLQY